MPLLASLGAAAALGIVLQSVSFGSTSASATQVGCPQGAGASAWLCGKKLDLNRATAKEIELIPDVGQGLASALVDARARQPGGFKSWDDVDVVEGVGGKTLVHLQRYADIDGR